MPQPAEAVLSTDAAVVDALRAGDEAAFTELVRLYGSQMVRVAMLFVPTRAVADEVVQDAWPGVLRGIDRFEGRSSLSRPESFASSPTSPRHDATVPHTLVLAPGLKIDKVYVGYWFWGRPTPYQLWEDLQDLLRRIRSDFDPTTAEARAAWEAAQAEAVAALS